LFNFIFTAKNRCGHVFGKYPQTIRFDLRAIYSSLKTFVSVCPAMWLAGPQATKESV
jgi:hypothetical protein